MKSIPTRQAAYLLDIYHSAKFIQEYVAGLTREQFLQDAKTQDAVLRRFLVAGEAASKVDEETRALFPAIPFQKIASMRNRIVHDYGNIDLDIVWETIENYLPDLYKELSDYFSRRGEE